MRAFFIYRSGFSRDFQYFYLPVKLFKGFYLPVRLFIYRSGFSNDVQRFLFTGRALYLSVAIFTGLSIFLFTGQAFQRFSFSGQAFYLPVRLSLRFLSFGLFLHFRGCEFRYTTMLFQSISSLIFNTHAGTT